eukprot:CAMPEP_0201904730 /NCGR_PEP_ID=MMETSP0902-20130614/56143_1 /ASSEMBLY_ACC=CAM_ASM_000551 /TAXON_ID=420261 /ORGANISM="Thalassiosira antarctica, Strain CCMP982" /LENGTH=74 /DNA_ID=CAMNT_0048438825 /DNA_START=1649 /DNA_END=1873 /DNA_ORIENTATION=+
MRCDSQLADSSFFMEPQHCLNHGIRHFGWRHGLVMLNVERWRHGMDAGMMAVSMALGILALAFCEGIGTPEWIR